MRISKKDGNSANPRRSCNLPRRSQSCRPTRTWEGTCRKNAEGSVQKPFASYGHGKGQEATQSPFLRQPQYPWEQGQRWKMQTEEERAGRRRRALGKAGGLAARAWRALPVAWALYSRASLRLVPAHHGWLGRIQLIAVSSSWSFKNRVKGEKKASVFFQACCKPRNHIQQIASSRSSSSSDNSSPALLPEVFITLKSLPV